MNTDKIARYLWIGRSDKDWYADTEVTIEYLFGEENVFKVASLLAATSINSSLKSNLALFHKALYQLENNLPFDGYLPVMKMQLDSYRETGFISGRKINNFALAMSGNKNAVVVDIWILRAFGYSNLTLRHSGPHAGKEREGGATKKQYDEIEKYIHEEAPLMGLQPREFCSMIWSGVRTNNTGFRNTTRYCDILANFIKRKQLHLNLTQ